MSEHPMMKCGCAGQATCSGRDGKIFDPPIPACIIHDCIEVADAPNLAGRIAKCSYSGCQTNPRKCTHYGNYGPDGRSEAPSSLDLPFFEYLGEGSRESTEKCKCGMAWIAHQPRWEIKINVARRWYKTDPYIAVMNRQFHAPVELSSQKAESEADFFRKQTHNAETKVYSAEVVSVAEIRNPTKCKQFVPKGPSEFDKYYCGCNGWD